MREWVLENDVSSARRATTPTPTSANFAMNKLRKARAAAQAQQVPLHPFLAGVNHDTPFWRDLPDILQAQLLVMLDNGMPTKRNPTPREPEKLSWAGAPHGPSLKRRACGRASEAGRRCPGRAGRRDGDDSGGSDIHGFICERERPL